MMMKRILKKIYKLYRRWRWTNWGGVWNFIHGFKATTIDFCGVNKKNYKDFISDFEFHKGHPWNGAYSGIIDNKIYLPFLFKDYGEYIPDFYYYKDEYGFLSLSNGACKCRINTKEFLNFLKMEKRLVLKHTYSEVGRGFLLLDYVDSNKYHVNDKDIDENDLIYLLDSLRDYVVQEYIVQHDAVAKINPSSLNTLRLLLVWNPNLNSFVVGRCFQRFGCNGNVVDNLGSGNGILVYVDPVSGKYCNYGVMNVRGEGDIFVENIKHPNSGYLFKGNEVVNYNIIKEQIIKIFNAISFLKFVALDVAITNDGFKIIETNSYPDPAVAQYKYGFKADPNFSILFK